MPKQRATETIYTRLNISVSVEELAYLRAKQREGYGISQFIRYLLEQAKEKDEVRKAQENKLN
jgi:hypothetical protein